MFTKAVLGWDLRYSILNELSLGPHLHNSKHERKDNPDISLQYSIMTHFFNSFFKKTNFLDGLKQVKHQYGIEHLPLCSNPYVWGEEMPLDPKTTSPLSYYVSFFTRQETIYCNEGENTLWGKKLEQYIKYSLLLSLFIFHGPETSIYASLRKQVN
jgi:hypothetical protein